MKNPFYKIPSYLDNNKKIAPEVYLNEIKGVFEKKFSSELNNIISTLNDAKEFEKENKLDQQTKNSYVQKLNDQFKKNPTPIGVFNAKNELAVKLGGQFLDSERASNLAKNLESLTKKGAGMDRLIKTLNTYVQAFSNIDEKYAMGAIDESFKESIDGLKAMIPEEIIVMDAQKIKDDNTRVSYGNIKNSYYNILDKTTQPEFKEPLDTLYPELSNSIFKGTNDPNFNSAFITQEVLKHQLGINKNGKHKKLRFNEEVSVREIPNRGDVHIYFPPEYELGKELSYSENTAIKKAEYYRDNSYELGSFKVVNHDFKNEKNIDSDTNSLSDFIKKEDSVAKLTGGVDVAEFSKPLNSKSLDSRHVTVHIHKKTENNSQKKHNGRKI